MRFALALPAVVAALLLLPAAAPAQAPPPDERAAAQAFADAAKRFEAATATIDDSDTSWMGPCERALGRIPAAHQPGALVLMIAHSLQLSFTQLRGPLAAFRTELANVATADPVLLSGRAAVRRMGRQVDAVPAPGRFCAQLRAWRRAGYPDSALRAPKEALDAIARSLTPGILRKLGATAIRLRELGVSKQDAEAFGGESGW